MNDIVIRILQRGANGNIEDKGQDFSPSDFAGMVPSIGDHIINPWIPGGQRREDGALIFPSRGVPTNRTLWLVVERFFNSKDLKSYVGLVVEERTLTPEEYSLV